MDNIKDTICERRKELGITQEKLAEMVGVSARTISRWEQGKNLPDLYYLRPLSDALQTDIQKLIGGKRTSSPEDNIIKYAVKKRGTFMRKMILGLFLLISALIITILPVYGFGISSAEITLLIFILLVMLAVSIFALGYFEK